MVNPYYLLLWVIGFSITEGLGAGIAFLVNADRPGTFWYALLGFNAIVVGVAIFAALVWGLVKLTDRLCDKGIDWDADHGR